MMPKTLFLVIALSLCYTTLGSTSSHTNCGLYFPQDSVQTPKNGTSVVHYGLYVAPLDPAPYTPPTWLGEMLIQFFFLTVFCSLVAGMIYSPYETAMLLLMFQAANRRK